MTRHPFQTLCCAQHAAGKAPILFAAAGSSITSFNLHDGSLAFQFPQSEDPESDVGSSDGDNDEFGNGDRPPKRRRLEKDTVGDLSRQESEDSIEIVAERQKGQRKKPKIESPKPANVSHLLPSSDGLHLIVVTAEDKAVNVYAIRSTGKLRFKSRRVMPKRLCAIILTPDQTTILAGDKFGDVYSLPLHPSKDFVPRNTIDETPIEEFKPSATELTVHTKGNLDALRQQREQRQKNARKTLPAFEHKLVLGHVSLLTDVAVVEVEFGSQTRQYILTADRDEHIRVSRGVSQAHIIENYCLGHKDFVSKLCILPWAPRLLVAGSGEPSLRVYDWQNGLALDVEHFSGVIRDDIARATGVEQGNPLLEKLAVSGIWPAEVRFSDENRPIDLPEHLILVAFEGLPLLLSYAVGQDGKLHHHQSMLLSGNVLDVAIIPGQRTAIISIDTIHQPGSTNVARPRELPAEQMFETLELFPGKNSNSNGDSLPTAHQGYVDSRWESTSLAIALNAAASGNESAAEVPEVSAPERGKGKGEYSAVGELLYGLENLRKKRDIGGDDVEGEDGAEGTVEDLGEH